MANAEHVGKAFQAYVEAIYPFAKDYTRESDKKLMEQVEKEVAKGAITFQVVENNILRDAAKKYTMADEDVKKLRNAANKRRGLR